MSVEVWDDVRWERILAQGIVDAGIDPSADIVRPRRIRGMSQRLRRLRHWVHWSARTRLCPLWHPMLERAARARGRKNGQAAAWFRCRHCQHWYIVAAVK